MNMQQGASWAMHCPQMSLPWCWDSAGTNPPRFANNVDGGLPIIGKIEKDLVEKLTAHMQPPPSSNPSDKERKQFPMLELR